ncbi:hypothetical protein D3C80_1505030 [compost metagenome]
MFSTSRTQPSTTTPEKPLAATAVAMMPPILEAVGTALPSMTITSPALDKVTSSMAPSCGDVLFATLYPGLKRAGPCLTVTAGPTMR